MDAEEIARELLAYAESPLGLRTAGEIAREAEGEWWFSAVGRDGRRFIVRVEEDLKRG